ncbi:MAG: PhzF family phenazine biosynthesis protein [Anaerovoracaceae bacterium]|nr:PhzF family phenazine biosynthesis protein [Anaerovoracaceae bacterium]
MKLNQYVVDAFTNKVFHGNPAAIIVLEDEFLPDELMIKIAAENNLSETAFLLKTGPKKYHLRWFTPAGEIDLCGHATLAASHALMTYFEKDADELTYETLSGDITVKINNGLYEMDFPAYDLKEIPVTDQLKDVCGVEPVAACMGRDILCVFENEQQVRDFEPDLAKIEALDGLLLHITAKGSGEYDCVSRTFAPKCNVPEDAVCGSGHCHIIPYWSHETGRDELTAYQASPRGGTLYCRMAGDRVKLCGKAAVFSEAVINC